MSTKRLQLKVGKTPDPNLATNNIVYLNRSDARSLRCRDQEQYLEVGKAIYKFRAHDAVPQGVLGLNMLQRNYGQFGLNDVVNVENYVLGKKERHFYLSQVAFTVRPGTEAPLQLEVDKIVTAFLAQYAEHFVSAGQSLILDYSPDVRLVFFTENCAAIDMAAALGQGASQTIPVERGLLMEATQLILRPAPNCSLRFSGSTSAGSSHSNAPLGSHHGPIAADWSFENMGIGGLDKEFSQIFRRAFASRLFPPAVIAKLGIRHTKGILLYGPPGTGKTLMARQIGKMLGGKVPPKLVMGPEILNKFVGQSEENIRNLFADAEKEYKARKEESDLHVIIFDEIDAICRARGSTTGGTGVADTIVNQLLSKIDGVEPLNNILVIGMTNRKDMIDEALLRPGRLEVHMEIGLPNEEGRCQIFRIHTEKMRNSGMLAADVDIAELAALAKNYTGAEIEGVVDSAASFALNREVDMDNLSKQLTGEDCTITRADFLRAFSEVPPAFGLDTNEFEGCAMNGIIDYGQAFAKLYKQCLGFVKQLQKSARTSIISILLEGSPGSGKTSLAAALAQRSAFPYSKFVSAERMVGMSDQMRMERIRRIFEDGYKSPYSVIVADDVERLLNYAPMGPIFSNQLLQTLFAVFKKQPPSGRKLLIIATTSQSRVLASLGLVEIFSQVLHVPNISSPAECCDVLRSLGGWSDADAIAASRSVQEIPIKKLISISEMAQQNEENLPLVTRFASALESHTSGRPAPAMSFNFDALAPYSDASSSSDAASSSM